MKLEGYGESPTLHPRFRSFTTVRNYVSDPKPFIQRHGSDGTTYMYPAAGENPTPFYEDLRATLPGVCNLNHEAKRRELIPDTGFDGISGAALPERGARDTMGP